MRGFGGVGRGLKAERVRQQESYDCGAAALCSVAGWFGRETSLAECRRLTGCMQDGITIKGILKGGEALGLECKALTSPTKELLPLVGLESPAIVHITTPERMFHYVVLCSVSAKRVSYMDPAEGEYLWLDSAEFCRRWNGHIIIFKEARSGATAGASAKGRRGSRGRGSRERKTLRIFARLMRNHVGEICGALAGSALLVFIGVSNSLFLKHLIDNALPAGEREVLTLLSVVLYALIIIGGAVGYGRSLLIVRNSLKIDYRLVTGYIRRVFAMPANFFKEYSTGDILSRVDDAFNIRALISEGIISIFISIATLLCAFGLMFSFYRNLAIMLLGTIPLYLLLYRISHRLGKRYNRAISIAGAKFESRVLDSLRGATTIKHYGAEALTIERIEGEYREMTRTLYRSGKSGAIVSTLSSALSTSASVTIISAGGYALFGGLLSLGDLVAFYTLSTLFTAPINNLIESNTLITQAMVSAERLFEIMNLAPEADSAPPDAPAEMDSSDLVLEGLSFSHIGRPPLLENIWIRLPKGSITAIVGSNGCGKSTLAQLIMRDLEPQSGSIKWGGRDIREYPLKVWRRNILLVPQQPQLFNTTLEENITCGALPVDNEALAEALRLAGLESLVARLPLGVLTNTGEGGALLSGGEMQKIAIARMIYRRPKGIILDEASSSMDSSSERKLFETLLRLRERGATIVVITHKESNLHYADSVVELDKINSAHCGGSPRAHLADNI